MVLKRKHLLCALVVATGALSAEASAQSSGGLGVAPRSALDALTAQYPLLSQDKEWTVEGEATTAFSNRPGQLGRIDSAFDNIYALSGRYTILNDLTFEGRLGVEHQIPVDDAQEPQVNLEDVRVGVNWAGTRFGEGGPELLMRGSVDLPTSEVARIHTQQARVRTRFDLRHRVHPRVVVSANVGGDKFFNEHRAPYEVAAADPDSPFNQPPPPGGGGGNPSNRPPPAFPEWIARAGVAGGVAIMPSLTLNMRLGFSHMITFDASAPPPRRPPPGGAGGPPPGGPPPGEAYEGGRVTQQRTSSSFLLNWQVVDWAFLSGGVTTRQLLFDAETDTLNFPLWDLANQGNSALEVGGRLVF